MEVLSLCIIMMTIFKQLNYGVCVNIVEDLKDAVLNAENLFGETMNNIAQAASQFQSVKKAWEDSVEENCVFSCPNGNKPVPNRYYKAQSNGCGVPGLEIKLDALPVRDMTKCCDAHDICYGTCGSSKDECDHAFKQCLYKICEGELGKLTSPIGCKTAAKMLYTGTHVLGCKFFKNAQQEACYCPKEKNKKYKTHDEF